MSSSSALLLLILAIFCFGCTQFAGYTPEEEVDARRILQGRPFYDRGKGTPAEYATNQRGQLNREAAILRGEIPGDYAEAVRKLAACFRDAERGFSWRTPRPELTVPQLAAAPVIDGVLRDACWQEAYRFRGAFLLNSEMPIPDDASCWRIGWHGESLYLAAEFQDKRLTVFRSTRFGTREQLFQGDSLECFIRPRRDLRLYWEFIVNPEGTLWELMHANNPWGGVATLSENLHTGAQAAARVTSEGVCVELALPLGELYGPWWRRALRPGDRFDFIAVRTDRNGDEYRRTAPVPFLYDGHNVFGYIQATLGARQ